MTVPVVTEVKASSCVFCRTNCHVDLHSIDLSG